MGAGQGRTTGKKEQECRRSQAQLKTCLRTLAVGSINIFFFPKINPSTWYILQIPPSVESVLGGFEVITLRCWCAALPVTLTVPDPGVRVGGNAGDFRSESEGVIYCPPPWCRNAALLPVPCSWCLWILFEVESKSCCCCCCQAAVLQLRRLEVTKCEPIIGVM